MKIIGHRGVYGHEPENTLLSISRAIDLGVDMIEVDVFVLPSGEIILMHDDRVDRTTNGSGLTLNLSFEYLRSLDAGKGEQIPTLQEAIELINRRVPLNIEIKAGGSSAAVAAILHDYISKGWESQDFLVSSFNHPELLAFKNVVPQVKTAALLYSIPLDYAGCCIPLKADIIAPATDQITPEFVADAHDRGLSLYAWVWQPVYEEETRRLYAMGVDGIYTDFPVQTRNFIKNVQ